MNYKNKIIGYVVIVFLLVLAGYIFTIFNGNPIEKTVFKNKTNKYLNEKYSFETEIDEVYYSFKSSDYIIYAHLKNKPQIKFRVTQTEDENKLDDDLINSIWGDELETELIPFVSKLYLDVKVITGVGSNSISDKYVDKSNVPNIMEIIESLKGRVNIRLHVNKEFNDDDYLKMFDLIKYIKNKNIYPSELVFWFELEKENKSKEFIKDFVYFDLYSADIQNIKDNTDLINFKK